MKNHALWITVIAVCLAACGEKQQAVPQQADEPLATTPAAEPPAVEAPAPDVDAVDEEFINHMHVHAEQLDDLNFALADGDLDGAMTPAYWLSRHNTVSGIPDEWQEYVTGMREAALAVESASDLDSARTAAELITVHCQGCHAAAGVASID